MSHFGIRASPLRFWLEVKKVTAFVQRVSAWALIGAAAALVALTWISTALAEADGDADGFDGEDLALPILGLGVVALVGWIAFQRRSKNSSR